MALVLALCMIPCALIATIFMALMNTNDLAFAVTSAQETVHAPERGVNCAYEPCRHVYCDEGTDDSSSDNSTLTSLTGYGSSRRFEIPHQPIQKRCPGELP